MASTQVDRFSASVPTTVPDMVGGTVEHVASGSLPQIQDASLLREAALKSRRARKHAVAQTQPTQESSATANGGTPIGDEDTLMEDATIRTKADAEDGEILENGRTHNSGGTDTFGIDAREKTPRPLSDVSNNHVKSAIGTEEPQYVRPGLKMTARDLEEAKRLILDLLGLGVKPEYLVDCGVSPQCLAVCFYEMNLRFPLNLDRRQINLPPVYDLDKHMKDSQWREQIIRQRDRNQVATAHFPIVAPSTSGSGESSALDSTTSSDPGSPGKKGSLADTSRVVREYTSPAPSHLNDERPLDSPSNGTRAGSATSTPPAGFMSAVDSSTLEDQKRMELLARKAAMESINRKRATKPLTTSATNESRPRDVQPNQLEIQDVASAVDALLASVRMDSVSSGQSEDISSKDGDRTSTGSGELLPDYDSDAMVEDELEARSPSFSDEPDDKTTDPALLLGRQRNLSPEHISPEASASTPSPRPASRVRFEAPGPARSSSLPVQPVPIAVPVVARKSRPIASDFIDQTPPRPASAFRNELERAAPLKRKRSFVDPSVWPKRLVIDLDSSDEEGEDEDEASAHPGTSNTSAPSSKTNTDRPPSRNGSHEKPGNDGRDVAAQMLLEKELQIKAMMQRIKMREMQKKKSASGTGTPVLPPANAASTASAGENNKTAGPASTAVSIASSPKVLTANTTPLPTPKFELPLEFAPGADAQQASTISDEGMTAHKVDKGKGKTTEFEEDPTQGSKDLTKNIPAVTTADGKIELEHPLNLESEKQAPTHFKAYTSPLIGFTSPSLQRSGPTDQQLPTMYWISSTAGQRQDTDRQLCQYEFPSGICKDQGCKDIHMRDFGASDDEIWKTATSMFPNAGPVGLNEIVARVRQSVQAQS